METFLPIPGHSGYEVSDHGTVKSLDRVAYRTTWVGLPSPLRVKGRTLKGTLIKCGYFVVTLSNGQKFYVHELVLLAFTGPRPNGMHINHKDGDKLNNHVDNLEYCTRSWNQAHSYHALQGKTPNTKLEASQVLAIKQRVLAGEPSTRIAPDYGVSKKTILDIKNGKSWGWLTGR